MGIFGSWDLILLVSLVKDMEEDAVRSCPSDVSFVEDLNDVFDVFLVGNALWHLEIVKEERRDISPDGEDFYLLVLFDEVPVVSLPVKDDEGDFVLDKFSRAFCDVRKMSTDADLREGRKIFTPGYACV